MRLQIKLLGGFQVDVDEVPVRPGAWARRHAASLVKLLALAPAGRLHREQVIAALWPELSVDAAAPRLHKAAHYARRALDAPEAVVLRRELVELLPGGDVRVDVHEFEGAAARAVSIGTSDAARAVLDAHPGRLLPDDLYEPWAEPARDRVGELRHDLLRQAGRWEDLLAEQPADEQAHLALARARADRGDLRGALRQLERLDQALRGELGTGPSMEAQRLRNQLEQRTPAAPQQRAHRLFGRRLVGDLLRQRLDTATAGRGSTLVFVGAPGVGKSAILDHAEALARRRGWRTGRGSAAAVEGLWPYAPVLEAISSLCRQHPALLDGLDDAYRAEIERAVAGRDVTWSGESGHQRLFVATAELVRLAAVGHGVLLVVDDIHEADDASLRLLHYLSRCAVSEPVLMVLAHRPLSGGAAQTVADSLVAHGAGTRVEVEPLSRSATERLLAAEAPDLDDRAVERIWAASGGLPFTVLEMARRHDDGPSAAVLPALPEAVIRTFSRVALLGTTFGTDELLAVSGLSEQEAYRHLEAALAALLVQRCPGGYCFRHALVREGLLAAMPPHQESTIRREVADQLATLGAAPGRVAHQYLAAGLPARAVPYVLRTVETAGALGAYRDALALVDAVREHCSTEQLPHMLARRGDLLMALGDPEAVAAYQEAVPVTAGTEHRLVRARLARAASFTGDMDTARSALAGLALDDDAADGSILLARGNLAYFSGDTTVARQVADQARERLQGPDDPWYLVDLVSLQGLLAHERGEWFDRFRIELRRTQGKERLVTAVFDAHLCVAEYLLYGHVPYAEVMAETEELRRRATQAGALRAVAFATALLGEAALLMGDLHRAERELEDAVVMHREIDAHAGEAHSLQRLAQLRLVQGDRAEAERLLRQALPLARWSMLARHVLHRLYGSMIEAAPDPLSARAVVDRAEATLGETDHCASCEVMLAVPATIACAGVGDLAAAHRHLAVARRSATLWQGTAWEAAVLEATAHVARAEGREQESAPLLADAARLFASVGHHADAARCGSDVGAVLPVATR